RHAARVELVEPCSGRVEPPLHGRGGEALVLLLAVQALLGHGRDDLAVFDECRRRDDQIVPDAQRSHAAESLLAGSRRLWPSLGPLLAQPGKTRTPMLRRVVPGRAGSSRELVETVPGMSAVPADDAPRGAIVVTVIGLIAI